MSERPKRKAVKKTNQGLATIRVASHTETVLPVPPGPPGSPVGTILSLISNPK